MKTKQLSAAISAATLAALLQHPAAHAQTEGAQAQSSGLEEVFVTAQRRSESLSRTPVAVAVLGTETLTRQAIVSEADLQLAVPGLTVKAGQNSNQLNYALRGQTVDSFSSSRPSVLPYFNEVQVGGSASTSLYDLASIQVLKGPQGTLFGRNSTGGAVLMTTAKPGEEFGGYLSGWVGDYDNVKLEGAVDMPIVPEKVLLRLSGFYQEADGFQDNKFRNETAGDIDRQNLRASLTIHATENISNEFVLDYSDAGGNSLVSVAYNTVPLGQSFVPTQLLYSPGLDAAFGSPGLWDAFLAAHPGTDPDGFEAFVAKQNKRGPFDIESDAPNIRKNENYIVSNITSFEINDNLKIRNIIGYTDIEFQIASEFDGTVYPADSGGAIGRKGTLTQFSEEIQLVGEAFDQQLSYVTGIYYSDEEDNTYSLSEIVDLSPIAPVTSQINNGKTTNETWAIYGQGTLDIGEMTGIDGLSVTAGVRYSEEDVEFLHKADDVYIANPVPPGATFENPLSDTFEQTSWTLGLQQQVTDDLLVYLASRRSYRSGGFNYFAPPIPGFGNQGGAEYDEEKATDVELGAKYSGAIGDMPVRLNAAVYQMEIEDIQRSNYVQIFGQLAGITVNVPESEIKGVELDGVISPTDWLSLGASVAYTDAEFTENKVAVLQNPEVEFGPYPDQPDWSGSVFADISFPIADSLTGSLRADVYTQTSSYFTSTADTLNPGSKIDGYTITNFRLGVANEDAGWEVAAYLKNAFDETYYVGGIGFASLFAVNTVIPGAPRTYMVEARYQF
jgi:iron complex outermembrane recepter protein